MYFCVIGSGAQREKKLKKTVLNLTLFSPPNLPVYKGCLNRNMSAAMRDIRGALRSDCHTAQRRQNIRYVLIGGMRETAR